MYVKIELKVTLTSQEPLSIQEVSGLLEYSELTGVSHQYLLNEVLHPDEDLYFRAEVDTKFLENYYEGQWFDSECGTASIDAVIAPVEISSADAKVIFTGEAAFEVACWVKNPNCSVKINSISLSDDEDMAEVVLELFYWDSLSEAEAVFSVKTENIKSLQH